MRSSEPVEPAESSLRPDDLLENATFLRRLAARLVGPDEAADVVQEAYAKVLAAPPRPLEAPRGWLATVVANLARNRRRARARRDLHERAAVRPERHEPADEGARALERLELQRVLAELVVSLPEEQRTVLFLRYFEGQSPSAIARRLGAPLKTIESRHTRALAQLRQELDARSDGDREAWALVFLPWCTSGSSGISLAAKAALLVVLLSGGLASWRVLRPASGPVEAPTGVRAMPIVEAPPRPDSSERREAIEGAAVVAARARLAGRVVTLESEGLAGITVSLFTVAGEEKAVTGTHGEFAFEWAEGQDVQLVKALASPTTTSSGTAFPGRIEVGETRAIELSVSSGATLSGRALLMDGTPLAGAKVSAFAGRRLAPGSSPFQPVERSVESAQDGSFTLEHLGEEFYLRAEADGLACVTSLRGELAAGTSATDLELRFTTARSFDGQVVDEGGRPVAGAQLSYLGRHWSESEDQTSVPGVVKLDAAELHGLSGVDGRFELGPFPREEARIRVHCFEFLPAQVDLRADAENRVVLTRGLVVKGIARDSRGQPLEGVLVRIGDGAQGQATSDARGAFELHGLSACTSAYLVASRAGYALQVIDPLLLHAGTPALELRLAPELRLAGRLLQPDGQPLSDAELRLEGERVIAIEATPPRESPTWEWAANKHRIRTDANGRFRFAELNPGNYLLHVEALADGTPVAEPFRVRAGDEELELILDRRRAEGVVFLGRVLDGRTGAPVSRFHVTPLETSLGSGPVRHVEDPDGHYRIAGFTPGRYQLLVGATGYGERRFPELDCVVGEVRHDVVLFPSCTVEFRLAKDSEIELVDLTFATPDGGSVWPESGLDGRVSMVQLVKPETRRLTLPGTLIVVHAVPSYGHPFSFELDLATPPSAPVVLDPELDPELAPRRIELMFLVSDDAELAGTEDPTRIEQALEGGRLEWPSAPVQVNFLDSDQRLLGRATVQPDGAGYRWHASLPAPAEGDELRELSGSTQGPTLALDLPGGIRVARLVLEGCEQEDVDLGDPALRAPGTHLVVFRRWP